MVPLDHTLAGGYHVASLRAEARRDALARRVAPRSLRTLTRLLGR
jgi:hypothetical protein